VASFLLHGVAFAALSHARAEAPAGRASASAWLDVALTRADERTEGQDQARAHGHEAPATERIPEAPEATPPEPVLAFVSEPPIADLDPLTPEPALRTRAPDWPAPRANARLEPRRAAAEGPTSRPVSAGAARARAARGAEEAVLRLVHRPDPREYDPRHDPRTASAGVLPFGDVQVEIVVGTSGTVRSARVLASSGHPTLDAAAVRGALLLRFAPIARAVKARPWFHFRP
jgi:protein TonB